MIITNPFMTIDSSVFFPKTECYFISMKSLLGGREDDVKSWHVVFAGGVHRHGVSVGPC